MTRRLHVATLGAPHGIKGLIRVFPLSGQADLFRTNLLFHTQEEGGARLHVTLARADAKGFLGQIEGVQDRTVAQSLTGTRLWLERTAFPDLAPGEYYHVDLIGLRALDGRGRSVGRVVGVENFGAGDLLEIKPESGETFYLPFTNATVPHVNLAAGTLTVEWPQGL